MTRFRTDRPWTEQDVADYFAVGRRTVRDWRNTDITFPLPLDLPGRTVRWWGQDIIDWARGTEGQVA